MPRTIMSDGNDEPFSTRFGKSGDFTGASDPFALFHEWMDEASASEINDPNAMSLATVDATGLPNVRMVLLKAVEGEDFIFYTNLESQKGHELARTPKAALCFHWKSIRRQVRVRGMVTPISAQQADAYFASRPQGSKIGAWASKQSRPLENKLAFKTAIAEYTAKFAAGNVPRPDYWSGFRVIPSCIEFWRERRFRLHDRLQFTRPSPDASWRRTRLYP